MSYKYRNPRLLPDGRINVELRYDKPHPLAEEGWLPYTASGHDTDPASVGRQVYSDALRDPELRPIDVVVPSSAELAHAAREERARRLRDSDWTQLPDVPDTTRAVWATYRQALRDITAQVDFPYRVTWPDIPV